MLVSEWANEFRHLSLESSAEPGKWRNSSAPYLVAPMDALSPYDPSEKVVCKFSSQTGKTEIILNFCGYVMHLDPGPILAIQPNVVPMGEAFSKDRINPMLRDSPALSSLVAPTRAQGSNSTITHKPFPGGHLTVAGANSPAGLASRPIRFFVGDEIDRWEVTKEGDPVLLARKRQQTYKARGRSKELLVSTPTYDDIGISSEFNSCTQQWQWQLGCPSCGEFQAPSIGHFTMDNDDVNSARYTCQKCGTSHPLSDEFVIKSTGKWVCIKDGPRVSVGYWMNQFSSMFARWSDTLGEWLGARGDSSKMQVVTNTVFCQGWEGEGDKVEASVLKSREEQYEAEVPDGVSVITIGADIQNDRIEAEIVGWGPNKESWSLAYHVLPGEPTGKDVWFDLLDLFKTPLRTKTGDPVFPAAMAVDSGAFTQHVYEFVKSARHKGIFPIKGISGMTRDQIDGDERARLKRMAKRLASGKPHENLGVDSIKRTVFHFLSAQLGKTGFCHFPVGRSEEYYKQLTGERLIPVSVRGRRPELRWKPVHPSVEALDCRVYAYGALLLHGVSRIDSRVAQRKPPKTPPNPQAQPARRGSFRTSIIR